MSMTTSRMRSVVALLVVSALAGCSGESATSTSSSTAASTVPPTSTSTTIPPTSTTSAATTTSSTTTTTLAPRVSGAVDVVARQAASGPGWFSEALSDLPEGDLAPEAVFEVSATPVENRRDGSISPTLVSSYVFLQFGEVGPDDLEEHAGTLRALFIRSALLSFVDYPGDRVLDWDGRSIAIPMDVAGMIGKANELDLPVFLEINYSDFVPGPLGIGGGRAAGRRQCRQHRPLLAGPAGSGPAGGGGDLRGRDRRRVGVRQCQADPGELRPDRAGTSHTRRPSRTPSRN